jgi:hypothetical protein
MFSAFKKIFGKDEKFYDLLEASAAEAQASTRLLSDYLKALGGPPPPPPQAALIQNPPQE